jgi:flagella basal body P-ring formation protein FlgA
VIDREEARRQVRRLLLSGDNTVKLRTGVRARATARERFLAAREIAVGQGLEPELVELIDRRLRQTPDPSAPVV